jgi:hypothetical protein
MKGRLRARLLGSAQIPVDLAFRLAEETIAGYGEGTDDENPDQPDQD